MSRVIIALDFPSQRDALALVDRLDHRAEWFKVGLELYTREGPGVVRALKGRGKKVFLDLKLLDIPNTVSRTVRAAAETGADLLTVHALGGAPMLRAAADAAGSELSVVAVTLLTSLTAPDIEATLGRTLHSVREEVIRLAKLARGEGLDGVVSSALEARDLRGVIGPDALIVTPGIRLAGGEQHDQARVATPGDAVRAGASHLVVGRAVTAAEDPGAALERVLAEVEAAAAESA